MTDQTTTAPSLVDRLATLDLQSSFNHPPFHPKFTTLRSHQVDAIAQVLGHFADEVKFVLMEAPTGSGKSLIAEVVRREAEFAKSLYVCTTKTLQDQAAADYPYAPVLKGRSNYPTLDYPHLFGSRFDSLNAGDCVKTREVLPACAGCPQTEHDEGTDEDGYEDDEEVLHCLNCHPYEHCPYEVAKSLALAAPLAITNTAYFVTEANGPARFSMVDLAKGIDMRRDLVIVDECDTLESILMSQVETVISPRRQAELGIDPPDKKTVEATWGPWVTNHALPRVGIALGQINSRTRDTKQIRQLKFLSNLQGRLKMLERELPRGEWVYDGYRSTRDGERGSIIFRPVTVDRFAPSMLWAHGKRWLCMSATIIDPEEYARSLGLGESHWEVVSVPSTFPAENRPIHILPAAEMTHKNSPKQWKERDGVDAWPMMVEMVGKVLTNRPTARTLVHTVSYDLAQYLHDHLRREHGSRLLIYGSAAERQSILDSFREIPNAVLLAPSMERGVDLAEDDCRVQIVAKVPFPNLGDKQVAARLYSKGGDLWYRVETVRSLVQMTGRGVRSDIDTCETFILDKTFITNIYKKSRQLLPAWWKEALDFTPPPGF